MVATANPLSTAAGYAVLRQGGSAVDAAVAIQMVLNLVEPQSSGIGGGAFMLVHDARRGKPLVYDGRETAPVAARPDRFLDESGRPLRFFAAVVGGRSVGVPGTLRMLGAAMQVVDQNGGLQIIVRTRGGWRGAADSRREGTVQGD
jgi:gamma-glutamyltranspeptidase/glutathione hydrolase